MARKVGQIVRRADGAWLVRVYSGRDAETKKRKYLNQTIHGGLRDAQAHLNKMLGQRDRGQNLDSSKQRLNQYLRKTAPVVHRHRPTRNRTCRESTLRNGPPHGGSNTGYTQRKNYWYMELSKATSVSPAYSNVTSPSSCCVLNSLTSQAQAEGSPAAALPGPLLQPALCECPG